MYLITTYNMIYVFIMMLNYYTSVLAILELILLLSSYWLFSYSKVLLPEGGSMMDSMYNSLLTSMSHVKEDCLRAAEKEQKPVVGQSGLHSLASAIDSSKFFVNYIEMLLYLIQLSPYLFCFRLALFFFIRCFWICYFKLRRDDWVDRHEPNEIRE